MSKRLKKRPTIYEIARGIGGRDNEYRGSFEKNVLSTFIPYKAETGTIRYVPRGIAGFTSLRVKAAGRNGIIITNLSSLSKNSNLEFDGVPLPERRELRKSTGMLITATTKPQCMNAGRIHRNINLRGN